MNWISPRLVLAAALALSVESFASTRYVNLNNRTPLPAYSSWAYAATNIQDAIDVAGQGDLILVTNGVYRTGGRVVRGSLTNRVAVTKAVTVKSVNGPAFTAIEGYQVPGTTNGMAAIRCVYLTNNAVLMGFTLTNGATWAGIASDDVSGGGVWCGSGAVVSNCVLTANSAADAGGGGRGSTFKNCILSHNRAGYSGGGAVNAALINCAVINNWARYSGGGAKGGSMTNCTLAANSAGFTGGGFASSGPFDSLRNCILFYNDAPALPNYDLSWGGTMRYCCTTPLLAGGIGNISTEPQMAGLTHISASSPCRSAGDPALTSGLDIDGDPWNSAPAMGCDEYRVGSTGKPLTVLVQASYTNVATGFEVDFAALTEGPTSSSRWDFGDGTVVSNRPVVSHSWSTAGDYTVRLEAFSESNLQGVVATVMVQVVTLLLHYVSLSSTEPQPPYSSWATAATNINDAIDAASVPGSVILVEGGIYATGGRSVAGYGTTNRVVITKPVTVQSVKGSAATVIEGYQVPGDIFGDAAMRCVYLADRAALTGFTLTNGATGINSDNMGGGALCASSRSLLSNSMLSRNSARSSGGGVVRGTLLNCSIIANSSDGDYGGGTYMSSLRNCTIACNSAGLGGGAYMSSATNCIIMFNTASSSTNYDSETVLEHCCTEPLPAGGSGNFTNDPLFLDLANGNLRLQSSSPCINAGYNPAAPPGPDLEGKPRIVGPNVDLGAYEFQFPASLISYAWLQQYGLPVDGSADLVDGDSDGFNNWQEWIAGTDPTDSLSSLRILTATGTAPTVTVTWQSVAQRTYFLQRASDLPGESAFVTLATNIPGQPGNASYTDANAPLSAPFFYRVGVVGE